MYPQLSAQSPQRPRGASVRAPERRGACPAGAEPGEGTRKGVILRLIRIILDSRIGVAQ